MSDKNNTENKPNILLTPKKRHVPLNGEMMNDETEKMSCLQLRRLKLDYLDVNYFLYNMPKLHLVATPGSRNRRSGNLGRRPFNISNELNKIIDASNEVKALEEFKDKKLEILEKLNETFNFKHSFIKIQQLDPSQRVPMEKWILNYPRLFETDMYSKFVNKILISSTKLSEVFLCQHRFNGQYYIVKTGHGPDFGSYSLSYSSREIVNELKILTLIGKHPHVADFYDAWMEDDKFHLQMTFIGGGSMMDFLVDNTTVCAVCDISKKSKINKLSDESAFILLAQISSVLVYMHDVLRIYHGDIKPSNILVDLLRYSSNDIGKAKSECRDILLGLTHNPRLRFKLCDFGRSGETDTMIMSDGDGRYLALLHDNCSNSHSRAISRDVFALGMTIYDCLGGIVTSDSASKIRDGCWEGCPDFMSAEWREILQKMTHTDANKRYTSREIIEIAKVKNFVLPEAMNYFKYDECSLPNTMEMN